MVEANPKKIKAIYDIRLLGQPRILAPHWKDHNTKSIYLQICLPMSSILPNFKIVRIFSRQKPLTISRIIFTLHTIIGQTKPRRRVHISGSLSFGDGRSAHTRDKIQKPIYYISRILRDAETRYSKLEKQVYALLITAWKLRPYFQAHTIALLINQPIKSILHWPDTSRCIIKWTIELSKFDVKFLPQPSIKVEILADFLIDFTIPDKPPEPEESKSSALIQDHTPGPTHT